MKPVTLDEWLRWQESLHPREIELGLDRVRRVAQRLPLRPPSDGVFIVAGTNGKGSTVEFLDMLLGAADHKVGAYTSPHLVRYNERVRVASEPVSDAVLIAAFERVAQAARDVPLTYFEFGTLAALLVFSEQRCNVWLLEVGLGGRLDAVNIIDPDFSIVTTVALDHQAWLGETVERIAAEKAGIFRATAPAFYGDTPVPRAIVASAAALGTRLRSCGEDFAFVAGNDRWQWSGESVELHDLPRDIILDEAQLKNISVALAAIEQFDPGLIEQDSVATALRAFAPPGRFQIIAREHQWILDVAHNPQAVRALAARLRALSSVRDVTFVLGMMADKPVEAIVAELDELAVRWILCDLDDPRAITAADLARRIAAVSEVPLDVTASPRLAFERAAQRAPAGARIVVCGSFRTVGPALQWLGLL